MRIRHLRIRLVTNKGLFGVDIPFQDGLFILRAENSMGKSTCLRAIFVALGMEALFTASRSDLPLTPALKENLQTSEGRAHIVESEIFVEIENKRNERIVVNRTLKGTRSPNVIEVTLGAALTDPKQYRSRQFLVGRSGDTTRELGFLKFLLDFLDWKVPVVPTFQGKERPLYAQCILPYIFVEQSRGWSTLEPPVPTWFGIKEVHKRAVEYLLDLDAITIAAKRLEIAEKEKSVEREWSSIVGSLKAIAKNVEGLLQRIPFKPVAAWPPQILPTIMLFQDGDWIPLNEKQSRLEVELDQLESQEIPQTDEIASDAELRLSELQERLSNRQTVFGRLFELYQLDKEEISATEERLSKIEDDLQRNKDTRTLLNLSDSFAPHVASHHCPTCHQPIVDSLTPLAEDQSVMSIDENINFLNEQRRIFQVVLKNQRNTTDDRERQLSAMQDEVSMLRNEIRVLKATLVSNDKSPSVAAIWERVKLQENLDRLGRAEGEFKIGLGFLEDLSKKWSDLQNEKGELPKIDISDRDVEKISRWGFLLREQLREYDFRSLEISEISISSETYRPLHEGFDLPNNISASDFIRVIWSYLNGLRELDQEFETNHPGLLVFDEPRQQSAKDFSFKKLLQRMSKTKLFHQIIFATSEKEDLLKEMLKDIPHIYYAFSGHLISRID